VYREIVRKEVTQNLLTTRFLTCLILSLFLIVFGALVGSREYRERLSDYGGLLSEEQNKLADVRVFSHIKPVVSRRPSPLTLFNLGYTDRVGNTVRITHTSVPFRASGGGLENDILALFPSFDVMGVVRYVLGLLALLLSFDAVSGEREAGTLRLVLSNPVSRATVALGKYLGGAVTLLVPLTVGFLAALFFLNINSPVGLSGHEWTRALMIVLSGALYLSTMLLIGLLLSALTHRSSTTLMLAMLVWLLLVVVVPNLSTFLASQAIEVETDRALRARVEALEAEAESVIEDFEGRLPPSQVMGDLSIYGIDEEVLVRLGRPERYAWLLDYYTYRNEQWIRYADRIWDVRRNHLYQLTRQAALAHGVSRVSPAYLVDRITQNFSGSGLQDHEDFMNAARQYRSELIDYVQKRGGYRSRTWFTDDPPGQEPLVLDPETFDRNNMDMDRAWSLLAAAREDPSRVLDLSDMPMFQEHTAGLAERLRRSSEEITLLVGLNIILFGLYSCAFTRYDAR
jgi:ABC-type transport system involved in multi-copper enzyme maturation permease subunit